MPSLAQARPFLRTSNAVASKPSSKFMCYLYCYKDTSVLFKMMCTVYDLYKIHEMCLLYITGFLKVNVLGEKRN